MEAIKNIQRAVDYIEENITDDLDSETIANQAFMSVSHFQRVFTALCGITTGEYIRNRRLTLAGNDVISTNLKIIDIAYKYGYATPESFSRAFLRFHNVSPRTARNRGEINVFTKLRIESVLERWCVMENTDTANMNSNNMLGDNMCDFCGKNENAVKILIKSHSNIYICDECVIVCGDLIKTTEKNLIK